MAARKVAPVLPPCHLRVVSSWDGDQVFAVPPCLTEPRPRHAAVGGLKLADDLTVLDLNARSQTAVAWRGGKAVHRQSGMCMDLSPNGERVAVVDEMGEVRVFGVVCEDWSDAKPIHTFLLEPVPAEGANDTDGRILMPRVKFVSDTILLASQAAADRVYQFHLTTGTMTRQVDSSLCHPVSSLVVNASTGLVLVTAGTGVLSVVDPTRNLTWPPLQFINTSFVGIRPTSFAWVSADVIVASGRYQAPRTGGFLQTFTLSTNAPGVSLNIEATPVLLKSTRDGSLLACVHTLGNSVSLSLFSLPHGQFLCTFDSLVLGSFVGLDFSPSARHLVVSVQDQRYDTMTQDAFHVFEVIVKNVHS